MTGVAPSSSSSSSAVAGGERRKGVRTAFRKERRATEKVRLLGQDIDLVKPEEVMHHVGRWVADGRKAVIANHNMHSLYLVRQSPEMQAFYARADLIELDSTPLMAFARMVGLNSRGFHRCTYLDWRDLFWSVANRKGWRVMYVGGTAEVCRIAAERLSARYPRAVIEARDGYFDVSKGSAENDAVLERIRAFAPQILFVGMGMPRQEAWIAQNLDVLPNAAIFSVGAAFDYEAGAQKTAPRWMGRAGLEWLYRLLGDPKRLFRRYCIEPFHLLDLFAADIRGAWRRRRGLRSAEKARQATRDAAPALDTRRNA
jgi:N-acetylglucosaminyldiphosphoundecaprenol N-acetyl-beta-D-mannosaminyltransferase